MVERKAKKRIRACPKEESIEDFIKIEVEDDETLEKISEHLDTFILECKKGHDIVLDVDDGILFYKKREGR
ncbi:MAG: hypothetical protein ACXQTS_01405 [Candidatus Methanospirareceae archaeon]